MKTNEINIREQHPEEARKKTGAIVSFCVHFTVIVLLFIPFLTFPDPPPGQEGIKVAFGVPDVGDMTENPSETAEPEEVEEEAVEEPVEEEVEQEVVEEEVVEEEVVEPEVKEEPKETKSPDVIRDEQAEALRLKKEREKQKQLEEEARKKAEAERKKRAEADRKRQEEARKKAEAAAQEAKRKAEAARKKAEAEARRKAAEEERKRKEAAAKALKDKLGGGFGKGKNKGKTGEKDGDPNAGKLGKGGDGTIGGGLSGRGVSSRPPKPQNSANKNATIRISICVDRNGKVTTASYTQKGSTSNDERLVKEALRNAKKYTFAKEAGAPDKQCGYVSYRFRVN